LLQLPGIYTTKDFAYYANLEAGLTSQFNYFLADFCFVFYPYYFKTFLGS
jgi:hypothetical protein